jgi:putative ABC transport system substrate-binding protein
VGYLALVSREQSLHLTKAFEEGLRSLGYRVGENVVIDYGFADGQMERPLALAAHLVRLGVDVIVAGTNVAACGHEGHHDHQSSLPTVRTVSAGLVASLARPGGNVTGFSSGLATRYGKRLSY